MERDDVIEYSLHAHHSEEDGKRIRKNIYKVTLILSVLTIVEVLMGVFFGKSIVGPESATWATVKTLFVVMTIIKAGYIVLVFMHLGEERKSLKWIILAPYALFILYMIFIILSESSALFELRQAWGF
ncbi:MAG: cytochrome C oxidase subunit IV [Crocinitomicaceae bacterium]|nr:cytochrome C oxidase subunit IV [Crocinitomicaceae bacterium]|tara:strand:- start:57 stop:440 length:384 start_codon:yes stop_codon:yes gene_type:complete